MMLWMALLACETEPDTITLSGIVTDAPRALGAPVAGADVVVFGEDLLEHARATTAGDGAFAVSVPALSQFYVHVEGEGRVTTAFSGTAGVIDLDAGEGYPWVADAAFIEAERAAHGACTTSSSVGAVVVGEARIYLPTTALSELPFAETATVTVMGSDAVLRSACVLDADGASVAAPDPVGATGRFAVFGVPSGPSIVSVSWVDPGGDTVINEFQFFVPSAGVVPLYPALAGILP
jgi:hypothetical protein